MNTGRLASTLLAVAVAAGGLTACGGSGDEAAVCGDVDELQSAVQNVEDIQLSETGLNALSSTVAQVGQAFQQLKANAAGEFSDEMSQVDASVTSLKSSVTAAQDDPTASTRSAVRTAADGVDSSVTALKDAVAGTC
jgi:hypothetical protein